jgi:hypothetical protein
VGVRAAAELLNEFLDVYFGEELLVQEWQLLGARHDVLNTMALPTMLLLLCRFAPRLFQHKGRWREPLLRKPTGNPRKLRPMATLGWKAPPRPAT